MVRFVARVLAPVGAALALVTATAGVGSAISGGDLPESPQPVTPATGDQHLNWKAHTQGTRKTVVSGTTSCHIIASPNYLGGQCVDINGEGGDGPSIKELLGGDPLPDCWDIPMTDRELEGMLLANSADYVWYWHKCLKGIDRQTFEIHGDGPVVWTGIEPKHRNPGPGEVITLTPNQELVVARYTGDTMIPAPILGISPSPIPLVNEEVSFYNYGANEVTTSIGDVGVQLRAHITDTQVLPEGRVNAQGRATGQLVKCSGTGYVAQPGETHASHEGCWYTYKDSSLRETGKRYKAEIHTTWQVEIKMPGEDWKPFSSFTKGNYWLIGVNEVQAVAVP